MLATEAHFHRLANSLAQLVWVVDGAGHLSYGNSAWHAFTAIGAGARFVEHYLPALHPADRSGWRNTWEQAMRCGEPYALERRIRGTPESNYVSQLEWGNPIRENGIGTGAWLITATDSDQNERRITDLRRQIENKERFLALLAHEMRCPLAPIANAVRLLQEHGGEPAIVRQSCVTLARQVAQLVRFTEDLFDLARSQNINFLFSDTPVELDAVIEAAVESSHPEITARGQSLLVGGATGVTLSGDAGRLAQVFANLLLNAAKFSNPGGAIHIRTEVDPTGCWSRYAIQGVESRPGCWLEYSSLTCKARAPRPVLQARVLDSHSSDTWWSSTAVR